MADIWTADQAHSDGQAEERAAIVVFLRRRDSFRLNSATEAADAIERGEHHKFTREATERRGEDRGSK